MVTRIVLQIRICAFEIRRRVFASPLQIFHRVNRQTLPFPSLSFLLSPLLLFITHRRVRIFEQRKKKKKKIKGEAKIGMKSVGGRKNYRPFYWLTLLSGLSRITGASLRDIMRTKRLPSRLVLMSSYARRNCLPLEIGKWSCSCFHAFSSQDETCIRQIIRQWNTWNEWPHVNVFISSLLMDCDGWWSSPRRQVLGIGLWYDGSLLIRKECWKKKEGNGIKSLNSFVWKNRVRMIIVESMLDHSYSQRI